MKKQKMTKGLILLCMSMIVVTGLVGVKAAQDEAAVIQDKKKGMMEQMHQCMMECTKNYDKNMKDISAAAAALEEAIKAIDAQDADQAKQQIRKAQQLLKQMQESQVECMKKMPTVNVRCPISGKPIDRMNTPENLTKIYKGQKVGFCCPACPPQWENLTEQEKDAKLKEAMPESSETTQGM